MHPEDLHDESAYEPQECRCSLVLPHRGEVRTPSLAIPGSSSLSLYVAVVEAVRERNQGRGFQPPPKRPGLHGAPREIEQLEGVPGDLMTTCSGSGGLVAKT